MTTNRKLMALAAATCVATALAVTPWRSASALPPRCADDPSSCPEHPGHPGPTEPPPPEAQTQPPPPFGQPSRFTYGDFANTAFAGINAKLTALPSPADAWPLPTIPFTPEIPNAPVKIVHAKDNIWAFVSYDAGGRPGDCVGTCTTTPEMPLNPNNGLFQATLRLRPRLDLEFYKVETGTDGQGHPTPLHAVFLTEATATLDMRAFAECANWESGTASLNAEIGIADATIQRDAGIMEKIWNFVIPGIAPSQNPAIRAALVDKIGVGRYEPNPLADGKPCRTLAVVGGASDGAIMWNEQPCIFPEWGCSNGGVNSP